MPQFEFDAEKSESNQAKHGIDFVEAQEIWNDENRVEITVRSNIEQRYQLVGIARGVLWSVIWTNRNDAVRIISVRRARTG